MQKEYRSRESYEDIVENCNNGNRGDAAELWVEFGRYANNLLKEYEEWDFSDWLSDLVLLVEMIAEKRYTMPY